MRYIFVIYTDYNGKTKSGTIEMGKTKESKRAAIQYKNIVESMGDDEYLEPYIQLE